MLRIPLPVAFIPVHPVVFIMYMYSRASCCLLLYMYPYAFCNLLYVHVFQCILFFSLCITYSSASNCLLCYINQCIRQSLFCTCPPVQPVAFILCACGSKDVCIQSSHFAYNPNINYVFLISIPFSILPRNNTTVRGRDSSVGIATRYGLDGPGIESRWGRDFPHPSRTTLGPTQPPIQWVLGLSRA